MGLRVGAGFSLPRLDTQLASDMAYWDLRYPSHQKELERMLHVPAEGQVLVQEEVIGHLVEDCKSLQASPYGQIKSTFIPVFAKGLQVLCTSVIEKHLQLIQALLLDPKSLQARVKALIGHLTNACAVFEQCTVLEENDVVSSLKNCLGEWTWIERLLDYKQRLRDLRVFVDSDLGTADSVVPEIKRGLDVDIEKIQTGSGRLKGFFVASLQKYETELQWIRVLVIYKKEIKKLAILICRALDRPVLLKEQIQESLRHMTADKHQLSQQSQEIRDGFADSVEECHVMFSWFDRFVFNSIELDQLSVDALEASGDITAS